MASITIRRAILDEISSVENCVVAAYQKYVARIGKPPAPMVADYAQLIGDGSVYVVESAHAVHGVLVIELRSDHVFIENVAVHPDRQGTGLGARLLEFAEDHARAHGLTELRLYTHERMTENLAYYPKHGYMEVDRRTVDGYERVFMCKRL